jgi:uncharacterized protein YidB (DUF937 family)
MGLFDTLVDVVSSQAGNAMGNGLLSTVMEMVNNPETGGLKGLVEKVAAGGLGEQVASWVGTGQNLPVSAAQIQSVLGSETVQNIAARFGIDPTAAADSLASMLPEVVNQLTPNGEVPATDSDLVQQGLTALTGFLGNKLNT